MATSLLTRLDTTHCYRRVFANGRDIVIMLSFTQVISGTVGSRYASGIVVVCQATYHTVELVIHEYIMDDIMAWRMVAALLQVSVTWS